MKPKNENKIILKQWVHVFIIIILLVGLSFGLWMVAKSFNRDINTKEELYSYNYNSNLDYKVYLKPNNFFTAQYLGMNKQYITSLIDHIDVNAKYSFQSSKELTYTYSYDMVATVKGTYSDGDAKSVEVWSKAYPILPAETKNGTGNTITIDKNITVDYKTYDQVMSDFRNEFGLSVDSRVDVAFKISITGGLPDGEQTLQETNTMTLQIPLLKQTIEIKPDYVNTGHDTIYKSTEDTSDINIPLLVFGIALILLMLFFLVKEVKRLLSVTKKSEYVLSFNKLLKEYGDIIAEAENVPDLSKYDIVNIKLFNDLVDIEEELHSPIICAEIREDMESWFLIMNNDTAYRYVLRYEDLDHFNR
ncbi:MAG: DUF5305 domain-containing protein [Bacilli bacterium]|nr:DUF5305 domain-containing protein [Bacilli bacterium]